MGKYNGLYETSFESSQSNKVYLTVLRKKNNPQIQKIIGVFGSEEKAEEAILNIYYEDWERWIVTKKLNF
jgi:hypothetical protein